MSLSTTLHAAIDAESTGANDLAAPTVKLKLSTASTRLDDGTAASQADKLFMDQRTVAGSGNEDLNLTTLVDHFGVALALAKVKSILIKAASGNTDDVVVSPAATNGFLGPFGDASDALSVPPGGSIMLNAPVNGWAVTATTADLINVAAGGATAVTYDVVLVGTSA